MILLDTCAIIWDALEPKNLSRKAAEAIDNADKHHALIVSDISIWEISMLIKKGRLEIETTAANFLNLFLQSRNISVRSISPEIAELSVNLGTEINNDPADRIIAATSIIHNARLVTADNNLRNSEIVDTVW
ncbi:type II toxin-antitoxin system VapC family toxin [Porticoccus sp. W117]|uniref:type II toxin-antitoxin system VapC family toxin n=1 Tax=Porticoccus sp. W117 TaxID=3054777 RepID=UPI002596317B|nr:type II toxin-antitoxin system VapC family toxin [Porticoccus sp. W117]MDM3871935.1 type II toxin-antitoxin system VapC family toxin [Porticoccus sp. W117]